MTSVRMDKWLWAARFFKTRALAARACELGRNQSNGQPAKAAREVRIGDMLRVTNDGGRHASVPANHLVPTRSLPGRRPRRWLHTPLAMACLRRQCRDGRCGRAAV